MKRILSLALAAALAFSLTACHKHTPGPAATCTADQVCTECGEVITAALGHEPGEEATCLAAQVCLRCGQELSPILPHTPSGPVSCTVDQTCTVCGTVLHRNQGHRVGEDGVCAVCGEQVVPAGRNYIAPGMGDAQSDAPDGVVAETVPSGHYTNDLASYYAGAVLICGDYGVEYFTPDPTGSSGYAQIVNDFAAKYPALNVTALLVPKCCAFESPADRTDAHDSIRDFIRSTYAMMDPSVHTADCFGAMEPHAGEYMFYRTDHHWTSLGAYYASQAYCEANGIQYRPLESYDTVYRGDVTGTLYMYGNHDANLKRNADYTACHFPATGYSMRCYNGGWYNALAINPKYHDYASVFINGDNPLTEITTDNKNGKTLLVFKESYGNAFVPYMIDYYEQIIVVDIRSNTDSVADLISRYHVTDALFINNCQAAIGFQSDIRSQCMS